MTGTTSISDVETIKIYTSKSVNQFDPRNPTGKGAILLGTATPTGGDITIPLSNYLYSGTNYIWVTYLLKETASEGNKVDAEVVSLTTAKETHTFSAGNPASNREILLRRTLVVAPGDYGSVSYRIPAITTAADGSLVALVDKRKNHSGDLPANIDVVANRSTDGGKTWSAPVVVAQGTSNNNGFGDACIITAKSGKLIALFVNGPGFWKSTPSTPLRTFMSTSTDNGQTWTTPTDLTPQIYGSQCTDPVRSQWLGLFFGSGRGLCTRTGRVMAVIAARVPAGTINNFAVYSDDEGQTWQVSNDAIVGGDEAKVVELNNGDILMSSRTSGNRLWAKSTDGGQTWGSKNSWSEIWGNACDADIVRFTSVNDGHDKNRLLHTLPNNSSRQNVTMWLSTDEGTTWPVKKTICPGVSAYSSVTILPDNTIGVYLEEDGVQAYNMYFLNFSLDWLTNGKDTYTAPVVAVAHPLSSLKPGTYFSTQSVSLTSATEGAKIYYTTDGSTPTSSSTLYSGTFTISNNVVVKAIAVKDGITNPSNVVVYNYKVQIAKPTISPASFNSMTNVEITITPGIKGSKNILHYRWKHTNNFINSLYSSFYGDQHYYREGYSRIGWHS